MAEQILLSADNDYQALESYIKDSNIKRLLLVCGKSIEKLKINDFFCGLEQKTGIKVIRFSEFSPNPTYESVASGVECFKTNGCEMIIAVGGGSAMDVAKCIKLYSSMSAEQNYLEQKIVPNDMKFAAIPTTAGTGSEATRFAVIYYQGEKQSVHHISCIPSAVLLDASMLYTLPEYQKKATLLDAFCHAVESFWSVNSTEESKEYSRQAITLILENMNGYLANSQEECEKMLLASNIAGKAINITQTTAGHAMCYKLTTLYGISHGHAAALCVTALWEYMAVHTEKCIDSRGSQYFQSMMEELAKIMGEADSEAVAKKFRDILRNLSMFVPEAREQDFDILRNSVNPIRLKNHPVELDLQTIDMLYHDILASK